MTAENLFLLAAEVGGEVRRAPGDVAALYLINGWQICNEDGTYDIWEDACGSGSSLSPVAFSLTHDEVVRRIREALAA